MENDTNFNEENTVFELERIVICTSTTPARTDTEYYFQRNQAFIEFLAFIDVKRRFHL